MKLIKCLNIISYYEIQFTLNTYKIKCNFTNSQEQYIDFYVYQKFLRKQNCLGIYVNIIFSKNKVTSL